jgi:hypothetical protein
MHDQLADPAAPCRGGMMLQPGPVHSMLGPEPPVASVCVPVNNVAGPDALDALI